MYKRFKYKKNEELFLSTENISLIVKVLAGFSATQIKRGYIVENIVNGDLFVCPEHFLYSFNTRLVN